MNNNELIEDCQWFVLINIEDTHLILKLN
jgi:hypothetical protein